MNDHQHAWYYYEFNGQPGMMCAICHTWMPS